MSRRRAAVKREVLPDAKFGDAVLTKFMNCLMYEGKKSVAERIVYGALDRIARRNAQDPLRVFHDALGNVRPAVEVRSRRVGGATYQVPVEVRPDRRTALAMRWLITFSRDRSEKSMPEKLAAEVIAAAKGEGNAIKKKEDTHRMAEANKAFSQAISTVSPASPSRQASGDPGASAWALSSVARICNARRSAP